MKGKLKTIILILLVVIAIVLMVMYIIKNNAKKEEIEEVWTTGGNFRRTRKARQGYRCTLKTRLHKKWAWS